MAQRVDYAKQSPQLFKKFVQFNAWNRINVGFKTVPGSSDVAYGLDKAHLN